MSYYEGQTQEAKVTGLPKMYGALELANMDFPENDWIISDILMPGVTHFAGKEKMFKSFAALGLCVAAANGDRYLGFVPKANIECLYFDLESDEKRPSKRLKLMRKALTLTNRCYVITDREMVTDVNGKKERCTLDNEHNYFPDMLREILNAYPDIKIVVIDVFKKIRSARRKNEREYDHDYRDVGLLKEIADEYNIAIILINHVVKSNKLYDDDMDMARGSGINAAADCNWLLKADTDKSGFLKIKGRDVESQEYEIYFDDTDFIWRRTVTRATEEIIAKRKKYLDTNILQTLQVLMKITPTWSGKLSQLIEASRKTGTPIPAEPKQLGMDLKQYEDLLKADGFTFIRDPSDKAYTFTNNNIVYKYDEK